MDNWQHISSPVGGLMAQVERRMKAQQALEASAILSETARATGNPHLTRLAAEQLIEFDREAERLQLGE